MPESDKAACWIAQQAALSLVVGSADLTVDIPGP